MKKFIWVIVAVLILGAGWYLGSPLFLDDTINEEFPGNREVVVLPSVEELNQMPPEQLAEIEDKMLQEFAKLPPVTMADPMPAEPTGPTQLKSGQFVDADNFHKGSGLAAVYSLEDGSRILRLEDFSVTNGPELHVLLVEHPKPTSQEDVKSGAYIDLAKLKGNQGNQNYDIPADLNLDDYQSVIIYCKPFHVVFSTATLN